MTFRLPSRYEDLDAAYRAKLRPQPELLDLVKKAYVAMTITGGVRLLPIFGRSGAGKSCAAWELQTHLPECRVLPFPREAVDSALAFSDFITNKLPPQLQAGKLTVLVIDQYEETVAQRGDLPSQFVERVSLLDRSPEGKRPLLFLWLTTKPEFQKLLADATSRNRRILVSGDFTLSGPPKLDWADLIKEAFSFHNGGTPLADYDILQDDIEAAANTSATLGDAIEAIAERLGAKAAGLQDLSEHHVVMLWPVTDGQGISRVTSFTEAREGYKLDWNTWYRELNNDDRQQLPLHAFNRARLYFDVRLVPIAAADLHPLCKDLDDDEVALGESYFKRFQASHFFQIVKGTWSADSFSPLRERVSERAREARDWYEGVTHEPTKICRRIARCLRLSDVEAKHEQTLSSPHATVRADVLALRPLVRQSKVIVELKAYNSQNTIPSAIRDAIRVTLRRHAHFGGFLPRQ